MTRLFFAVIIKVTSVVAFAAVASAQSQDICEQISSNASVGRVIKGSAISDYEAAIRCIVPRIAGFEDDLANRRILPSLQGGYREYLSMADALQEMIIEIGRPAISEIRSVATPTFASALAAGARSPEYNIRIASSYILSNVIDNSTACVVIDYLHAPVEESDYDNPDINGRANLVYTLNAVVLWSYKEIFEAIVMTQDKISRKIRELPTSQQDNLDSTREGLRNIGERINRVEKGGGLRSSDSLEAFANLSMPDTKREACERYRYRYWLGDDNPFLQSDT